MHFYNEAGEREIEESITFTIAPNTMQYLGINLTKEVKDLYPENYRTLIKKLKMTQRDKKKIHAHELEEQILLKCP